MVTIPRTRALATCVLILVWLQAVFLAQELPAPDITPLFLFLSTMAEAQANQGAGGKKGRKR